MDAIVRFEGMYGEDRWPCQSNVHTHTYTHTPHTQRNTTQHNTRSRTRIHDKASLVNSC
jgi:hypothetical protein